MLLMIDNYDSFTFNLVQYFGELGADVRVFRNDEIDVAGIAALKPGLTSVDVLRAAFPAGTVSGAPKVRAMEIIDELEPTKRGIYSGAAGYISFQDDMDTAIVLRTAVLKDGVLYAQAGGGIVHDSSPDGEWQETLNKLRAVLRAAEMVQQGLDDE